MLIHFIQNKKNNMVLTFFLWMKQSPFCFKETTFSKFVKTTFNYRLRKTVQEQKAI